MQRAQVAQLKKTDKYKNVTLKKTKTRFSFLLQNQNKRQLLSMRDFIWCHSQQAPIPLGEYRGGSTCSKTNCCWWLGVMAEGSAASFQCTHRYKHRKRALCNRVLLGLRITTTHDQSQPRGTHGALIGPAM